MGTSGPAIVEQLESWNCLTTPEHVTPLGTLHEHWPMAQARVSRYERQVWCAVP
jgi:hypothetical protein